MAGSLVGGAALGAAFGELFRAVDNGIINAVQFKSTLTSLRSRLNQISPMLEEIDKLNRKLGRLEQDTEMFTNRLKKGLHLINKCEKIPWWNCFKKWFYTNKLKGLEQSIVMFFQIEAQAQMSMDSRKILVVVNEVDEKLERMNTFGSGGWGCNGKGIAGWCEVPGVPNFVVGFEEPLQELKTMVLEGGEQVVAISGPGGCGKSTLAKMLCHDKEIEGIFKDNIFFVAFSKAPNLKVITERLLQHNGYQVPQFQTDEEAMNQLESMLNRIGQPILLVLDDVWFGSEFIVENFKFQISDYKILITSRSVFPRFSSTHRLNLLKDEQAMALFCHLAFPQGGSSSYIPDDLVKKIVRGCGGFPLALEVVGKSLKGESEVTWNSRLNRWLEGQSIFYSDAAPNGATDILNRLQTTLDALDAKIKECYLDLASFPEDQRIPAMALVDMWVELYNLDEVSAFANIHELSDRNLLNLVPARKDASEINGYYNEHFVTQHDLLREVATHQIDQNPIHRSRLIMDISGNDLPKWWIEQGQHPIRLVSISTGEISNGHNMQLSKVEVLLLNIQIRNYTLPQLMEKMDQLKVLIVTNYGFYSAEISNFPLLGHLSSLKRIRFEHISISSIAKTMLRLKNLQKISLVMCKFDDAFGNCTIQIADMLPNLVEIVIDCCNDLVEFPAWLCNISGLKRLDITNCHELIALPEAFVKLDNLEVLRLHACTKLLELPESIGRLQKFRFLDLSDCISISKLTERMGELSSLRKLNVRGCRGLSELPSSVKNLKQLEDLICDEETGHLWENYKIHLPNLKFHVLKEDVNLDWLK
ncbi:putative disease resistance protein [Camellia lanceoleosa]|uniref:Disease resistance protein n=1 Tax=Camellia lanceoleosa TaxID=1840588 RepID=A0ACC0J3B5_9ERIC|nr:putative disease resistance protein [Camellia lanceoleosa]